jgi:hypothetical protein
MSSPEFAHLPLLARSHAHEPQTPSHVMRAPRFVNSNMLSQGGSPYLGHNSTSPLSGSEPPSRAPSIAPGGGDYNHLLGRHQQQQPTHGFNQTVHPSFFHDSIGQEVQNTVSQLRVDLQHLSEGTQKFYEQMMTTTKNLTSRVESLEKTSQEQQTMLAQLAARVHANPQDIPPKKKAASRNVVNEHPILKVSFKSEWKTEDLPASRRQFIQCFSTFVASIS